jgi:endonuclease YncB( thermonuclease family)
MSYLLKCCFYDTSNILINWNNVDSNVNEFGFKGETKVAKIVSVYDGDTVKVVFPVLKKLIKFNCRIQGVDTPELRTRNIAEKEYGTFVRDKLREKILNKMVYIKCGDFDKYGRLLIDITPWNKGVKGETISDWLIKNKYALVYDGGTKKDWGEYLRKYLLN